MNWSDIKTVEEFDAIPQKDRMCPGCHEPALAKFNELNNNGVGIECVNCGRRHALRSFGIMWLKHRHTNRRDKLPHGVTLEVIWEQFKDHCVCCSQPKELLVNLGIGLTIQHVVPYSPLGGPKGHQGVFVPMCTHCHYYASGMKHNIERIAQHLGMGSTDDAA